MLPFLLNTQNFFYSTIFLSFKYLQNNIHLYKFYETFITYLKKFTSNFMQSFLFLVSKLFRCLSYFFPTPLFG